MIFGELTFLEHFAAVFDLPFVDAHLHRPSHHQPFQGHHRGYLRIVACLRSFLLHPHRQDRRRGCCWQSHHLVIKDFGLIKLHLKEDACLIP